MLVDYTNQRRAAETIRTALIQNHSFAPYFDDNNRHGVWNVYCISGWSRCRMENGLAWVIGGLISSLFLTLIIVPVIYEIMEN
jgi:HAE1 family hydrophobic/amphiphilic exporter-1